MGCSSSTESVVDTGMQFAFIPQNQNQHLRQRNSPIPERLSLSRETINSNSDMETESVGLNNQDNVDTTSDKDTESVHSSSKLEKHQNEVVPSSSNTDDVIDEAAEKTVDNSGTYEQHSNAQREEECVQTRPIVKASMPLKVYSADRQIRKLLAVASYQDLLDKCRERLNHDENTIIKIVLNEDGMEVDEESFEFLPANSNVMILADGEEWIMEGNKMKQSYETTLPDEANQQLGLLKQLIARRPQTKQNDTEITDHSVEYSEPSFVEEVSCVSVSPVKRSSNRTVSLDSIVVSHGWKDFSKRNNVYYQVRSSKFHKIPTGDISLSNTATYDDVLKQLQNIYFPRGKNFRGNLSMYDSCLGNGKSKVVPRENFSFRKFMKDPTTHKIKINLMTKEKDVKKANKTSRQATIRNEHLTLQTDESQQRSYNNSPVQSQTTCSSLRSSTASSLPSRHEQITQTTPVPVSRHSTPGRSATPCAQQNNQVVPVTNVTNQVRQSTPPRASRRLNRQPIPVATGNQQGTSNNVSGPPSAKSSRSVIQAEHSAAQQESTVRTCPICADAESDAVIIPCMHALCYVCGIYLMSYGLPCHMCRGTIFQVKSIHYN